MKKSKSLKENISELRKMIVDLAKFYNVEKKGLLKLELSDEVVKLVLFDYFDDEKYIFNQNLKKSDILNYIDFSNVNFNGFDLNHENFKCFHNVKINPQTVFCKKMSFFTSGNVELIGDGDLFEGVELSNADLTGAHIKNSKSYPLNPQTVRDRNLMNFKSGDIELIGDEDMFKDVYLYGANLTGAHTKDSKSYPLNPQTVFHKMLENFTSGNAEFVGNEDLFEGVRLDYANLKGSSNCYINPQTIYSMKGINLDGVIFSGAENMWYGYSAEEIEYFLQGTSQLNESIQELSDCMQKLRKLISND